MSTSPFVSNVLRLALALTATAAVTTAQIPGAYDLQGSSCTTGGSSVCLSQNDPPPNYVARSLPNFYAYLAVNGANPITVTGFSIYTQSVSGTQTVPAAIYLSVGATPDSNPVVTGQITVGPTLGWYAATLNAPVTIPANGRFYVAHYTGNSEVRPADAGTSGVAAGTTYYRRGPGLTGSWTASVTVDSPTYRVQCGTGPVPVLSVTGVPSVNQQFTIHLTGAPGSTPAVLIFGLSDTTYLGASLPIDLTFIGATGCSAYVSLDWQGGGMTMNDGTVSLPFFIPNVPSLAGARFYNQWAVIAFGANPLDLLTTNYGAATIGG